MATQFGGNDSGFKFRSCYTGSEFSHARGVNNNPKANLMASFTFEGMSTVLTGYSGQQGVVFGNGTEASVDDYVLSGDVISGIVATASVTMENDGETAIRRAVYTITNSNADAITVSEIGCIGYVPYSAAETTLGLIEHTVLDSPVTIPAGSVGQVTYTIRMNYPTA